MKKKIFGILTAVLVILASVSLADDGLGLIAAPVLAPDEAQEAVRKVYPNAVIHYAVEERDDGRMEWNVFFTDGTMLGQCEVDAQTWAVREKKTWQMPEGALTADQAVEKLAAEKGALTILELELDRDNGRLWYEGEAELDGKRYEFEMTVTGEIVEWER